jgi:Fe-S-cluster containining protein
MSTEAPRRGRSYPAPAHRWGSSKERAELLAIYRRADALFDGWSCACTAEGADGMERAECCQFAITGREPYTTSVELAEVLHAVRRDNVLADGKRGRRAGRQPLLRRSAPMALPLVDTRPCPLLSAEGRCTIYASRPFGCRTFFCRGAEGPAGARSKVPRSELQELTRSLSDLSAAFDPVDPWPRPLVRAVLGSRG